MQAITTLVQLNIVLIEPGRWVIGRERPLEPQLEMLASLDWERARWLDGKSCNAESANLLRSRL